ncbi:MAG: response regulator [Acidobacteriia bacterium]|nr:response regulator [Terriglobia bacterium]
MAKIESGRLTLQEHTFDLHRMLDGLIEMFRLRAIEKGLTLIVDRAPDVPRYVRADESKLRQVLINLLGNAVKFTHEGGIGLRVYPLSIFPSVAANGSEAKEGRLAFEVQDTGPGIAPEELEAVFEPFVQATSGYKSQEGTGLGLAMVYGIVKQSGGYIWVYSEVGQGTTIKIHLPCVEEVPSTLEVPRRAAERRGTETILLVEDEAAVRSLVHGVLEQGGYRVLVARNGEDALIVSEQHKGPIHLLVTDVIMPEMGGPELAEHLRPFHRAMKVLYISGYTDDAIVHHGVLGSTATFLQKPFTPDLLAQKVREILDSA